MVKLVICYYTTGLEIELLNEDDNVTLAPWDRELPLGKTGYSTTGDLLLHTTGLEIELLTKDDNVILAD